jgi:hypothetical protein
VATDAAREGLKDPGNDDPRVVELRRLHEEMDRAVLAAYGCADVAVPPYCPATDEDRAALQAFEDEVIDRLFILNAERAAEEKRLGAAAGAKQKGAKGGAKGKAGKKGGKAEQGAQLGLPEGKPVKS